MAILNKPDTSTQELDTGASLAPDTLYLIDEGTGTDLTNDGLDSGSHNATLSGPDWSTDTGRDYLTFEDGNSDIATVSSIFGVTTDAALCFVVRIATGSSSGSAQCAGSFGDSAEVDRFVGAQFDGSAGDWEAISRYDGSLDVHSFGATDYRDDSWHLVIHNHSTDHKEISVDGSVFSGPDTTLYTFPGGMDRFKLGARADSSESSYIDMDLGGFWVYKDKNLTDGEASSLWNSGDPWSVFLNAVSADVEFVAPHPQRLVRRASRRPARR